LFENSVKLNKETYLFYPHLPFCELVLRCI